MRARARPASLPLRQLLVDGAHLAALSALAIAQPVFDLLSENAEFFAVRGSTSTEIVVFALAVLLVPPAGLLLLEALAGLAGEQARRILHLLFVGGLVSFIALRALKQAAEPSTAPLLLGALAAGAAAILLYWRLRPVRSLVSVLGFAPVLFLALFLFFSPVEKLVFPEDAKASLANVQAQPDVVLILFDEFPISSLMDARGQIDTVRYPNFGALARDSTWFRNTTGMHQGTNAAVPAVLDARLPKRGRFPTFADHPNNLFTLLGRTYRLNVFETETHLCPSELCGNPLGEESFTGRMHTLFEDAGIVYLHMVVPVAYEQRLPSIQTSWHHFRGAARQGTRVEAFQKFVNSISASRRRPTLHFLHSLLPHGTWTLMPSCRQYVTPRYSPGLEGRGRRWGPNPWLVTQAYQRHLLQVSCVDRLLGILVERLRQTGVYDRALVIVTADHGVSIKAGEGRRQVDPRRPTNLQDMAFVPLFVKRPGEHETGIVETHMRTVDIVPTIADVLGVRIPWRVDGRSVFGKGHSDRVDFMTDLGWAHSSSRRLARRRDATLRRQVRLFGSGRSGPGVFGVGPNAELIGRRVGSLRVRAAAARVSLDDAVAELVRSLPAGSNRTPAQLLGSIEGPGAAANRPLAIAVNGRIAAVSRTYARGSSVRFTAFTPESAFHPGRNRVEIFWAVGARNEVALERLGGG
jgi:hypothetical protein